MAAQTGATVHLVRTWMDEYGIARRPAHGVAGRPRPLPRRRQPPPREELIRLRVDQRWRLPELAERYRVHPQTVSRWLSDYHIPAPTRRRKPPGISAAELLVDRYLDSDVTATELGRQVGLSAVQVAAELRAAGVAVDRTRRPASIRPRLERAERIWAIQRYTTDEWPMARIADALGCSVRTVRTVLVDAGVTIARRTGASRHDRIEAPLDQVESLYVTDGLTAEQTGDTGVTPGIVLRTGHSYGLPIRPGGVPRKVSTDIHLIDDLYADHAVNEVLNKYRIPRRPPIGGIAARFHHPIAITAELVRALYVDAGCSTTHIELLTGQPRDTVATRMAEWGISLRPPRAVPPVLVRMRAAHRQAWLDHIVDRYQQTGSTALIARENGCTQTTVQRWLHTAGAKLPGRGQWHRNAGLPRPFEYP